MIAHAHALADVAGALLTLLALGALGGGGYLLAVRLLGLERAASDALALAAAWLLAATGLGVGIGLALGACGQLRLAPGLALALLACGALLAWRPREGAAEPPPAPSAAGDGGWAALARPARHLGSRLAAHLRQHWVLSLLACHAIGTEALRGLVRPPLSWDSLMYHLMLAATWLQRHDLAPVFGAYPMNYYGYTPGNGAVWLWWWMAPSHGELYANLAFLPQWALLAVATGGGARRLGARRAWPLAAFLVAMTPTVVRFAATQYVDIFTAACLLGACCFGLSWLREPRGGDAALAGIGLGLAAGAKVLGLVYAAALAAALLPLAVGSWRRRAVQAAAALALAAALGGFFYLRNAARGVDPLALECEGLPHRRPERGLPALPRPGSVAAMPRQMLAEGRLARAFLGTAAEGRSPFVDLGLGPQALVVLLGIPALAALPRERRREAAVAGSQVLAEVVFWLAVPYAAAGHVFANVRYLLPAVGLAFAGGVAAAEARRADERLLHGLAVALAAQDLLQLHTLMPDGVRLAVAAADLAVVALALSPRLRKLRTLRKLRDLRGGLGAPGGARQGGRWALAGSARVPALAVLSALAVLCGVAALSAVPWLARFRATDRTRAFTQEYTAHGINVALYAAGWDWLERHGGSGTVAVVNSPDTFFIYPAMGPRLERRAVYVNVNAANLDEAAAYPLCQPRVQPDAAAWIANLRTAGVRWLDLTRTPPFPFPMENDWARAHPELFVPRFSDSTNLVYELLPRAEARVAPAALPPPKARMGTQVRVAGAARDTSAARAAPATAVIIGEQGAGLPRPEVRRPPA
jgi:hypothetical protein